MKTLLPFLAFPTVAAFAPTIVLLQRTSVQLSATTTTAPVESCPYNVLEHADPTVEAPLPPTYTECPFTGILAGPQSFYRQASQALNAPNVFSFLDKNNQPMAEVSGGKAVRQLLKQEFTTLSSNAVAGVSQLVCGKQSLRTAQDPLEHKALRQLIGVPLAPSVVGKSLPRLEAIGRDRIAEHVQESQEITAVDMAFDMALDVAYQQVLGLEFETEAEIAAFHQKAHTWLNGMWYKKGSQELEACLEAKEYLVEAIDNKINQLLEAGEGDGSTVGGLVYATMDDVEDNSNGENQDRTLSRQEIIDNCLLMLLAATETTASNTANALFLMGLRPDSWQRVVEEQKAIVSKYGEALTPEVIKSCTYLNAVIQEVLRILPVTLVSKRVPTETIEVGGTQIPKGWGVSYNIYMTHEQDETMGEEHMDLLKGFQPERWLNPEQRRSKDYLPFGVGPRQCPGAFLAQTEMKAFLSLLAREMPRYELVNHKDFDSNIPIDEQVRWHKISAVIRPEDGVRIRVLPKPEE